MRVLRAGLVLLGAAAAVVALGVAASADVVDPASAYQPASTRLVSEEPPPAEEQHPLFPAEPLEQALAAGVEPEGGEVAATPAPEQIVTKAPARVLATERNAPAERSASVVDRAIARAGEGFHSISAFFGRVTSATQGGVGPGAGGPALVLAVLAVVTALDQRRVLRTRWVTDEEAPEFLYAREVICPG